MYALKQLHLSLPARVVLTCPLCTCLNVLCPLLSRCQEQGIQAMLGRLTGLTDDFFAYAERACSMAFPVNATSRLNWLHQRMAATMGVMMRNYGVLNQLVHLLLPNPEYKFIQLDELTSIDTRGGYITKVSAWLFDRKRRCV